MGGGIAGMGSKFLTDLSEGRYVFRLPRYVGGYFRNEADHRDFVAIGMAAGQPSVPSFVNGGPMSGTVGFEVNRRVECLVGGMSSSLEALCGLSMHAALLQVVCPCTGQACHGLHCQLLCVGCWRATYFSMTVNVYVCACLRVETWVYVCGGTVYHVHLLDGMRGL